jgi:hypothetical protein
MEQRMEQDLLRLRPAEPQISIALQSRFLQHRQQQKETGAPIRLTAEIKVIAAVVIHCSSNPILTLRSLGMIFFGRTAAFNLSLLAGQIICCRARVITAFHAENWEEVRSDQDTGIASVVGANEVKHWSVFNVPQHTELSDFLKTTPRLLATEQSFGLDRAPDEVLIGPNLPPHDLLAEPHFPLVSIEYDRAIEVSEVATIPPAQRRIGPRKTVLSFKFCSQVTIDYNDGK